MKQRENEAVAPRCTAILTRLIMGTAILAVSIVVGFHTAPECTELPVMLASGEVITQPCYVTVEGKCVVLVEDEETAEEVVARVKDEYKSAATTEIEIEEETSIETMELKNGDPKPEILSARKASEEIMDRKALTVKTKEVIEAEQPVEYKIIEVDTDELNVGETCVEQQGQAGMEVVVKEVFKENGQIVSEEIVSRQTLVESVPEIVKYGTSGMVMPLDELRLTSGFGARWGRQHNGLDLAMPGGAPVYAARDGIVTCAEYRDSFGNLVILDHGSGLETYYAHCSRLDVLPGQHVSAGRQIAAVGSTGNSTGPHLHFEVRQDGIPQDPAPWLGMTD